MNSLDKSSRFETLSTRKKIAIIITSIIFLLLALELIGRAAFYFLDKKWGYPSEDIAYYPYVTYFNSPLRKQLEIPKTSPFFIKDKYSVVLGTDKYGFALDSGDNPHRDLTQKSECEYRIFMLGGSTVEGRFLSSQNDTLAARLEILLKKEHPSIDFQVINAGDGSYFSAQEVVLHLFYISPANQPDHIIYFNGSNDFSLWPKNELPGLGGNMNPHTNQLFKRAKAINTMEGAINLLLQRMSNWSAIIYTLHKGINYPTKLKNLLNIKDNYKKIGPNEWIKKHLDRYFYNMNLALNAATRDTPVSYFLQPTLLPETPASEKEMLFIKNYFQPNGFHNYNYFDSKQIFYTQARSLLKNFKKAQQNTHANAYDLSLLFLSKEQNKTVFADHVHYLPIGREIISESIFTSIKNNLKNQLHSHPFSNCLKKNN